MTAMHMWWQAAAAVEAAVTAVCALFTGAFFLHVSYRSATLARRGAALTLALLEDGGEEGEA